MILAVIRRQTICYGFTVIYKSPTCRTLRGLNYTPSISADFDLRVHARILPCHTQATEVVPVRRTWGIIFVGTPD